MTPEEPKPFNKVTERDWVMQHYELALTRAEKTRLFYQALWLTYWKETVHLNRALARANAKIKRLKAMLPKPEKRCP